MSAAKFIKTYHNVNSLYINTTEKWLWLRIHKTAGTSMYDGFLYQHCMNINKKDEHEAVKQWIQDITDQDLKSYAIWTYVRNPYDRFNSMAAMFKKEPNDFAKNFDTYIKNGVIFRHSRPQHLFTHHNGVQIPNFVFAFEGLSYNFKTLCRILNLPKHELGRWNSTQHDTWQSAFNQDTINFVNNYYDLDFKYFKYLQL